MVMAKASTNEHVLSRREVEVTKEEHPHLEAMRINLGSVGKTAVMETGALLEMMKAAMDSMHQLVDERDRLQQAKVKSRVKVMMEK